MYGMLLFIQSSLIVTVRADTVFINRHKDSAEWICVKSVRIFHGDPNFSAGPGDDTLMSHDSS